MPTLKHIVPAYRRHKSSDQAVVTLDGRDFYLGKHKSKKSRAKYDRLVGQWQANGRCLPAALRPSGAELSVYELVDVYFEHAKRYYVKEGKPTSEQSCIRSATRPLNELYGETAASAFGPLALKAVREEMIKSKLARGAINGYIARIKQMFKWAVAGELVPPSVHHGLEAVTGLKKGRCEVRESEPIKPVPEAFVDATLPHVAPQVAAMIRIQLLTGMRPGEVTKMRGCDLDVTGPIWIYTPHGHKTEHHELTRTVMIGPKAKEVLKPWLRTDTQAFLFSPVEAELARNADRRRQRKSPMTPSQARRRSKLRRKRAPRDHYTSDTYRRAITYGIQKANSKIDDEDNKIPNWHPHQLRHNAATRIRKEYGLEAARVVLGHRSAAVSELYAEIDATKAAEIMRAVG